jgi:hypothetical protein
MFDRNKPGGGQKMKNVKRLAFLALILILSFSAPFFILLFAKSISSLFYLMPLVIYGIGSMCKILLDGADEWKKMGRRSII